jgi:hypothetical protein
MCVSNPVVIVSVNTSPCRTLYMPRRMEGSWLPCLTSPIAFLCDMDTCRHISATTTSFPWWSWHVWFWCGAAAPRGQGQLFIGKYNPVWSCRTPRIESANEKALFLRTYEKALITAVWMPAQLLFPTLPLVPWRATILRLPHHTHASGQDLSSCRIRTLPSPIQASRRCHDIEVTGEGWTGVSVPVAFFSS